MSRLSKIGAACLAAFGWTSGSAVSASYLVVAGGGGGANFGGGGGAGGFRTGTSISLNPSLSYTVTVGAGGVGTNPYGTNGTNGSDSVFSTITSTGGGGGGSNVNNGSSGGSGGGGSRTGTGGAASPVTSPVQGYAGGNGATNGSTYFNSGGGGGSGAVGNNAIAVSGNTQGGGTGGAGTASSISGTSVTYAGGGGGGGYGANGGPGGSSIGGQGGGDFTTATSAVVSTGSGGGGGANSVSGGNGSSGIVIISYPAPQKFSGGVVTLSGGNVIHTFTTSGTLGPITTLSASYLIVAGGGSGGGGYYAGGGGAGGLLSGSGLTIDPNSTYLVTVGAGAASVSGNSTNGLQGSSSAFSMVATTAVGGGYGAGYGASGVIGGVGGSGGGNGANALATVASGTAGQGNAGGQSSNNGGGGGGGAGSVGGNAGASFGTGGTGSASSISGSSVTYAAGGNGGITGVGNGASGTANTGNGGAASSAAGGTSGAGGSGVVIISYPGSTQLLAGGTVTIVGGNVIHTFTSTGYLAPIKYASNSLRFRASASGYLSRTPSVAGNRKTFTFSAWMKRGDISTSENPIFAGYTDASNRWYVRFEQNNIRVYWNVAGTSNEVLTSAVYRDPAAWYHVVVAVDTTQTTDTNRIKVYVNGVQQTLTGTYIPQNTDTQWNNTVVQTIGKKDSAATYYDGYMTEVNSIDGQALTPNSFGTFNSYGVWQPITYGGSYGTNGFYLPFTNKTSTTTLGYDFSPNGNNWTTNNISLTAGVTYDSMTDVPTLTSATAANYCTLNPIDSAGATISDGNLKYTLGVGSNYTTRSTIGMTTGKWYAEWTWTSGTNSDVGIATAQASLSQYLGQNAYGWIYYNDGNKYTNGSGAAYGATYANGDVIGIAFDADAGTLTFYKNGTSQGVAFTGLTSGPYFFAIGSSSTTGFYNFGQRPFTYTPPTGFVALNTYNL